MKRTIKQSSEPLIPSLSSAFSSFISSKEALGLSPKSISNYEKTFSLFTSYFSFNNLTPITSVTQQTIYQFIQHLKNKDLSTYSINSYLRNLRTFFNFCYDQQIISERIVCKELRAQEAMPKCYSDEEIEALLIKPARNSSYTEQRTYAIVNTVLATGMRAGSIVSLTLSSISFTKGEIYLPHTKNKKASVLPLSSALSTVLHDFIKTWRSSAQPSDYLFCNVGESQMTTNALRLSYVRYCQDRGVSQTSIHGLRHTFARYFIRNGGNPLVLQRLLGHSSLTMTRRYVALFSEDLKQGYDDYAPLDTLKKSASRKKKVRSDR